MQFITTGALADYELCTSYHEHKLKQVEAGISGWSYIAGGYVNEIKDLQQELSDEKNKLEYVTKQWDDASKKNIIANRMYAQTAKELDNARKEIEKPYRELLVSLNDSLGMLEDTVKGNEGKSITILRGCINNLLSNGKE